MSFRSSTDNGDDDHGVDSPLVNNNNNNSPLGGGVRRRSSYSPRLINLDNRIIVTTDSVSKQIDVLSSVSFVFHLSIFYLITLSSSSSFASTASYDGDDISKWLLSSTTGDDNLKIIMLCFYFSWILLVDLPGFLIARFKIYWGCWYAAVMHSIFFIAFGEDCFGFLLRFHIDISSFVRELFA
jgi:hypothetical protein